MVSGEVGLSSSQVMSCSRKKTIVKFLEEINSEYGQEVESVKKEGIKKKQLRRSLSMCRLDQDKSSISRNLGTGNDREVLKLWDPRRQYRRKK